MIPDLPDPLGLPRPYGERAPHALRRVARRVHLMGTWHGISRLVRDPVWKAGTASLVSFPLLAGVYQAVTGGAVAIEPSRFPPQSVDMFWAGIAAALATLVYRAACPAAIKEQLRSSEYAGYRPHIVAALRHDVVAAFSELMLEVRLTAEHAAGERLRGRAGEAELIETLLAQGFTPVRYGFGCRELYAVRELAMRVGDAADLPVRASMGRGRPFEPVTPDLWMLPAQGIDLFHLELARRGPADSATEG
ncbi:MAG TPA: hypothetical protein VFQ39_10025, partial [Longimicrobium sp.]|nr:hypothetical protein [Longimicrobium sp.]